MIASHNLQAKGRFGYTNAVKIVRMVMNMLWKFNARRESPFIMRNPAVCAWTIKKLLCSEALKKNRTSATKFFHPFSQVNNFYVRNFPVGSTISANFSQNTSFCEFFTFKHCFFSKESQKWRKTALMRKIAFNLYTPFNLSPKFQSFPRELFTLQR